LVLARRPVIELRGPLHLQLLGGRLPGIRARLLGVRSEPAVPAELTAGARGSEYVIRLRPDPAIVGGLSQARILVTFDAFFVPARIGLNPDTRELVIQQPTDVRL
jgi:hypothetical protein